MRPDDASLTDIPVQSALAEVQVHAGDLRRTVYGPSVFGTVRVDDPGAVAALHRLRAPEVPRPEAAPAPYPPYPTPAGARVPATVVVVDASAPVPALAIAGAALAVPLPPVGHALSVVALGRITRARPRPPGELLAVLGIVASILAMTAVIALALG